MALLPLALLATWVAWRAAQPSPPSGFTVLLDGAPKNLDPRFATSDFCVKLSRLVFSSLVTVDNATGEAELDLATRIDQVTPTHYRIEVRKDARWHDGEPVTAEDVHYTLTTLDDEKVKSPYAGLSRRIEKVEVHDLHTLSIHLNEPHAPFLTDLAIGIVPRHLLEDQGQFEEDVFVGSGPFVYAGRQDNAWVAISANPRYHGGAPPLDEVVFRIIPDDNTRLLALMGGSGQLAQNAVSPMMLPVIQKDPDLVVESAPSFKYTYLGLNVGQGKLKDKRVREAIALGIDRDEIIQYKFNGSARKATGLLSPSHWAYHSGVKVWDRDVERAKALLTEAGYPDPDGEGPAPRLQLTYKTTTNKFRRSIADLIATQLGEIGIEVKVVAYEWGTFFGDIKAGNFEICSLQWPSVIEPDLYSWIFHSSKIPTAENRSAGANRGRYVNPALDELLDAGRLETDREKRKAIYAQVQAILAEDLPYISLWHEDNILVRHHRLSDYEIVPNARFRGLEKASFSTSDPL